MTSPVAPSLPDTWRWPLDLEAFDRTPHLRPAESAALGELLQRFADHRTCWPPHLARSLTRLTAPISTVLDLTGAQGGTRSTVMSFVLRAMQQRQSSLFAWTPAEWHALLGPQRDHFQQRYWLTKECRFHLLALAYLLGGVRDLYRCGVFHHTHLACICFGAEAVKEAIQRVQAVLRTWGYGTASTQEQLPKTVCAVLLASGSPQLEDITLEVVSAMRAGTPARYHKTNLARLTRVLHHLDILPVVLPAVLTPSGCCAGDDARTGVPAVWSDWCSRWRATATLAPSTKARIYYALLAVGRWLAATHADCVAPEQWTRDLAAECVAAVTQMRVGQWAHADRLSADKRDQPLAPRSQAAILAALQTFFRDCQEWTWIPRRFDPTRAFAIPRTLRACLAPDPRVIADDIWAKLLWAGLNLTAADLPTPGVGTAPADRGTWYPLELIRAVVMVWLFAGLRSDEIQRLRVGCIRWQPDAGPPSGTDGEVPNALVCLLDVPVNKTGAAFTKPVDRVVGEAIAAWERVRPPQPASLDPKTAEYVQYLFAYRGRRMGKAYINTTVIPMLCKRAGVPEADARGPITSHRARSTIASHLFNAREPMSLVELQHWLGHRSPSATQHYAKITPTRLAKAYQDADYFGRNMRTIEVLIDQSAVLNGEAARGLPWKYYDLGHGYCTYDFFEHCEHRMACAQCGFYRPKPGFLALLREKQAHLLHMQEDIPLTDIELAVVAGDLAATEQLIAQLSDVATPAGPTPRQLHAFGQDGATPVMQRQADGRGSSKERRGEGGEGGAGEGVGA